MAMRRPTMRLNSADLPTFGRPTIAINPGMRWTVGEPPKFLKVKETERQINGGGRAVGDFPGNAVGRTVCIRPRKRPAIRGLKYLCDRRACPRPSLPGGHDMLVCQAERPGPTRSGLAGKPQAGGCGSPK